MIDLFMRPTRKILAVLSLTIFISLPGCGGGGGGGGGIVGGGGGGEPSNPAPQPPPATFTVTGNVVVSGGTVADSDVNDPNASFTPNDTFSTAQDIPNPVSVGGYVNQPGEGDPGRSQGAGDTSDIYRISVVTGQRITLFIGDSLPPNDLDLFLGDAIGNLVDSSQGVSNTETIISPVTGTYFIEVFAFNGASTYVLTVGQQIVANSASTLSVLDDFVPGETVVRFSGVSGVKSNGVTSLSSKASAMGLDTRAGALDREVLLSLGSTKQTNNAKQVLNINSSEKSQSVLMQSANIDSSKIETIRMIKALRQRPDIKYADPNYILQPLLLPNDEHYSLQWHYPLINLPQAWDVSTGSSSVIVAVIDTGVILAHPDLQGRLIQGYDFIKDKTTSRDGDGIDNNPDDPGDLNNGGSSSFHGTHVAGTIGAATNNITGVSGVTWSTSIMPLRALGFLGGTLFDVAQAVRYAAGLGNDSGTLPAQRSDVINLSLGGGSFSQIEQDLFTEVRNQGVIVIASAGNNNTNTPFYPAAYNGVVSVSAVNINKTKASYSSFGSTVDVAAPGGDGTDINGDGILDQVLSTVGDDSSGSIQLNYGLKNGTSMAAPHVAGVVALMKAVNPALTPVAFDALLSSGQITDDLGSTGRDDIYGHGLIDAHKAVVAAGGSPVTPGLVANPSSLNFGTIGTSLPLTLENGGGGVLTVNTPTDNASWLTVTESNVDVNKNGTYTVSADRASLSAGTYTATITITSSANTVSVPVIMQVSSVAVPSDAGFQYILLIDPVTGNTVDDVATSATNGRYSYRFNNVPGGNYLITSGSDSNNDFFICGAGESCGAYLTLDQPLEVNVNSNQSLSDFSTGYISGFSTLSTKTSGITGRSYRRLDKNNVTRQLQK